MTLLPGSMLEAGLASQAQSVGIGPDYQDYLEATQTFLRSFEYRDMDTHFLQ